MCECYCADCRRFVARCFGVAAVAGCCFLDGCAIDRRKKTPQKRCFIWFGFVYLICVSGLNPLTGVFAIKVAILPVYIPIRYVPLASDISRPMRETNDPPVFSHSFIRKCCTIGCDKIYWIPTRPSVRAVSDDFFQFDCFHVLILFGFCSLLHR